MVLCVVGVCESGVGGGDGDGGCAGSAHLIGTGDGVGGMHGSAHREDVGVGVVGVGFFHLIGDGVWIGVWEDEKSVLGMVEVGVDDGRIRGSG